MGKGIEQARALNPDHAQIMEDLRDQLLIVFLRRLGGAVSMSVDEVDGTGGLALRVAMDPSRRRLHFDIVAAPVAADAESRAEGS